MVGRKLEHFAHVYMIADGINEGLLYVGFSLGNRCLWGFIKWDGWMDGGG